jgi:hypothetical protein
MWLFGSPDTDIVSVHLALMWNVDSLEKISLSMKPSSSIFNCILKHRRLFSSFHTVIFGIPNSLLALATDLRGLHWNASHILSMLSPDTRGRLGLLPLHQDPVSTNCRYNLDTLFLCDASFLRCARNSRCIVITDQDTSKWSTQKDFSCCYAILETGPAACSKHEKRTAGSAWETLTVPTADSVCCARVRR